MISKDKTYRTRDGREVRIYATDGFGRSPIHGAVNCSESWVCLTWHPSGRFCDLESEDDLIEVKPRIKRTVWLHVYTNGYVEATSKPHWRNGPCINGPYDGEKPIACVKVDIDCEEGEGL